MHTVMRGIHENSRSIIVAATVSAIVSTLLCLSFIKGSDLLLEEGNIVSRRTQVEIPFDRSASDELLKFSEEKYRKHLEQRENVRKSIDCSKSKWPNMWVCGLKFFQMTYLSPLYPCHKEFHLAKWGEGGKWVCDVDGAVKRDTGVVYSVGSKGQTEFEAAIFREFNIKTHTFDPTLSEKGLDFVRSLEYVHFSETGLTGEDDSDAALKKLNRVAAISPNAKMMKFGEIMNALNHSFVDILKVDCERCEETFIKDLATVARRTAPLFGQLFIEFHRLNDTSISLPLLEILEDLGYRQFHAEPNFYFMNHNWELAYIHESLVLPSNSKGST